VAALKVEVVEVRLAAADIHQSASNVYNDPGVVGTGSDSKSVNVQPSAHNTFAKNAKELQNTGMTDHSRTKKTSAENCYWLVLQKPTNVSLQSRLFVMWISLCLAVINTLQLRDVFEDAMVKAKARSFRIKATYAYEILCDY